MNHSLKETPNLTWIGRLGGVAVNRVLSKKTLNIYAMSVAFAYSKVYYLRVIEKYMTSTGVFRDQVHKTGHPDL